MSITALEAKKNSDLFNEQYENAIVKYSSINDETEFENFIMDMIEKYSKLGSTSFEWTTKYDLNKTNILKHIENLGYDIKFYELSYSDSNDKYCLLINWY